MSVREEVKDLAYYKALNYEVIISYDSFDKIFIARIPELPGCLSHGESPDEAFEMIEESKEAWLEAALMSNIKIFEPSDKEYSGKFVVRVPKSLHKQLVEKAKLEGVSLNQYVNTKLASSS